VIKKTLNPKWEETFLMDVDTEKFKILWIEVRDKDALKTNFLGELRLDLTKEIFTEKR